jgi:predicted nucleotidyltransferase
MILNPDFKEFFQLLNANGVRYLIVGGYAVAYHGYPRYTKDIDVWIWINSENADRVVKTLDDFGFESLGLETKDFLEAGTIIQLGYAPNRIDLIMGIPGVDFEESYAAREEEEIDGVKLNFIDLENLKKSKKAAGRLQDLADIENLG